jgi:hypothetical protein
VRTGTPTANRLAAIADLQPLWEALTAWRHTMASRYELSITAMLELNATHRYAMADYVEDTCK